MGHAIRSQVDRCVCGHRRDQHDVIGKHLMCTAWAGGDEKMPDRDRKVCTCLKFRLAPADPEPVDVTQRGGAAA